MVKILPAGNVWLGKAEYTVENGVIIGRTVMNSRNTFLVTEKEYGDFILEADVWVEDEEGNAGIQTRSHFNLKRLMVKEEYMAGNVKSILHSAGGREEFMMKAEETGFIHAIKSRLLKIVYKKGEYNHFKVECIGNEMKTWVNGVATAYVVDTLDPKGFIGLQVHAINSADHAGKKVGFKNIRIKTTDLKPTPFPANVYVANFVPNSLTGL
jgi:hypothetical protein